MNIPNDRFYDHRKPAPSSDYSKFDPETGEQTHDERGSEIPDPNPMQPPVGYNPQPSLAQQIRQMIISDRLAREAAEAGMETFEEADDFEVGDDFEEERHSPYEGNFDPMTPHERAALSSQGKDPDKILTPEDEARFTPKPKKTSRAATSGAPVSEGLSPEDPSEDVEGNNS